MKKLIISGVLIIMLLPFTACAEKLPTGDELISKVFMAMSGVDSYKEQMDITMQIYLEADEFTEEAPFTMDVAVDSTINYDVVNEEMEMNMEFDIATEGEDMTMKMAMVIYLVDGMLYTMMDIPMAPAEWTKSEVPEDYWDEMDYIEMQLDLLEAAEIEVLGKELKDSVECYMIQITPDMEKLFELMMDQTQTAFGEFSASEFEQISEMFKSYSVKMWVEKETSLIVYAALEMYIEATPEMMGVYDEEGFMSINATMNMKFFNYNQPVEIVLPPEAEDAEESFMW